MEQSDVSRGLAGILNEPGNIFQAYIYFSGICVNSYNARTTEKELFFQVAVVPSLS